MTLPSVTQTNGVVPGCIMIIIGALISYYSGMLLVSCADKCESDKIEDFAERAYGPRMSKFVSWVMVVCLLGFVVTYIVTVKELVPQVIKIFKCGATWTDDECTLPAPISDGRWSG